MDNKKNGIPKLRFPGFTGAWEQRKLGEGTLKIGDGLHGTPKYSTSGNVLFINGNNLINGKVVITSETKRVTSNEQSKDDKELNQNTILMSINGTIGSLAWYRNENLMLGKSVAYIEVSEFDKKFVYAYLQTTKVKFYFISSLTGTTIKNLGLKAIRETPLLIPNIEEQEKIGEFFQQLDSLIALHQRKLEHLQEQKKGLLQKMFPKNGETVPEVRFPGFTDAWEQRRLGEVAEIKTGSRNHQDSVDNGKYPFFVRSEKVERLNEYDFDTKAILVPGDGRIGEIFHYYDGKFALHQRVYKVDNFKEVNPLYLLNLFKYKFKKHALRLNAQGTVPSLRLPMFTNWNILIPNLNEQQKIGLFFQQLDSLITLHQRKLEHLELMKKGLLQQMFV